MLSEGAHFGARNCVLAGASGPVGLAGFACNALEMKPLSVRARTVARRLPHWLYPVHKNLPTGRRRTSVTGLCGFDGFLDEV